MSEHTKPRWTAEQVEILSRHYSETPEAELAAHLGRTPADVINKACSLGLKKAHTTTTRWREPSDA